MGAVLALHSSSDVLGVGVASASRAVGPKEAMHLAQWTLYPIARAVVALSTPKSS